MTYRVIQNSKNTFFLQILERTVAATVKTVIAFEYQKSLVWQYSQPGVSELIPTAN